MVWFLTIKINYICQNHDILTEKDDLSHILFVYGSNKFIGKQGSDTKQTCLEVIQIWSNALLQNKSGMFRPFWQEQKFSDFSCEQIDSFNGINSEIKSIDELIKIGPDYQRLLTNCIYGI